MKIKEKAFEDIIVGAEKEMSFSIDSDNSLIFEILRDKMYKDKIGSICREVMSNCRDANREAGSDKNISVTIIEPDQIVYVGHQSVSFKDKGIGITPDRMEKVYLKYAASTKRDTNGQTGGFGLGAKTPFAYNDTFTVITVCDVDGVRMKYYYTALIDSTRKGKMVLFDTEETTEDTGTEVIVPIKTPSDRAEFERKAFFFTKFWGCVDYNNFSTKPTIPVIHHTSVHYDIVDAESTCLIIDGIPYPLETGWGFRDLKMARGQAVALKFETGELTISANRESVQYDEDTVSKIKGKCERVYEDLYLIMSTFLTNFPTYLDACRFKANLEMSTFPMRGNNDTMFDMVVNCIGVKGYNRYVLTEEFKKEDFTFESRKIVTRVTFGHHEICRVRDKDTFYNRRGQKVYKKYDSLPLTQLGKGDLYYGDFKDSKRNTTLFDEVGEKFYLIMPNPKSTEKEIADELKEMEDIFGIHYHSYEDVVPTKVVRNKTTYVSSKVPASMYSIKYSDNQKDLYYDSTSKALYNDEECTSKLDTSKICFVSVDRVSSRISWSQEDLFNFVVEEGWKIIKVGHVNYEKKISKCGVKNLHEVHREIQELNSARWIEEGKKFLIRESVRSVSKNILGYAEVLPADLLPQSVRNYNTGEIEEAEKYGSSYDRVREKIKMSSWGITEKLRKNLKKYPLLVTYIDNSKDSQEKVAENIQQYIKQIESYEK